MKNLKEEISTDNCFYPLDKDGSLISGVKLDPDKTYPGISELLQRFIDENHEESWTEITHRIDYIYDGVLTMLNKLDEETNFMYQVKRHIYDGKILLFKPNLMSPECISATTHSKTLDLPLNTQWPLVAAIMRWFHNKGKIHYSHMALGEGSCSVDLYSTLYSKALGYKIPNEAVFEGRCGDFYGGWGFYFVRKYLASHSTGSLDDNPMEGYEESCNGIYLPPGKAKNKMMVYDLNQIQVDPARGRTIHVPGGENYSEIILHKVLVGGDILNPEDLNLYPGSVLINIPILKLHAQDLITNSLKNLGIGLYPTQCAHSKDPKDTKWIYASPDSNLPCYKSKLPHSPWMLEINEKTHLPQKDEKGNYISHKTKGFSGTQCDVLKVVQSQGILMVHISDNVNIINISHCVGYLAKPIPEGFIWASLDCVALDNFCAGYCFNNLPLKFSKEIQKRNHWSTNFLQKVPVPVIKNQQIISEVGFDSPLLRYTLYTDAEKRGLGYCDYHICGLNIITKSPLASHEGHLIEYSNGNWKELITKTLYYNPQTLLHDLQITVLNYVKANDMLFKTNLYQELMEMLDENHDGIIDYNEKGMGFENTMIEPMAYALNVEAYEKYGALKSSFIKSMVLLKYSNSNWNPEGHDFLKTKTFLLQLANAFALSQGKEIHQDLFYPKIIYGKGYWPSFKTAQYINNMTLLFGSLTLEAISLNSIYGCIFRYCDQTTNNGLYSQTENPLSNYFKDLQQGKPPLNFTFYVPLGLGKIQGNNIPNTIETSDSKLIFTAHFREIW